MTEAPLPIKLSQAHWKHYLQLIRFNKPIGSFLLLWPTLWALWIAGRGHPSLTLLLVFTAGVFLTRSAGVIVNDLADRHVDKAVQRTATRPLATGVVSTKEAFLLVLLLSTMAAGLLLFLNPLTRLLALMAAGLAVLYPFCKRFTHLPQCVLGLAFAWPVLMAFSAQTGTVSLVGGYLFAIAVLWPITYDTFYAMADREEDKKIGVKSTAILLGTYDRLGTAILQALMLIMLAYLGFWLSLGLAYYSSLLIATGLVIYMQKLIRHRRPAQCLKAFYTNNWLGLIIFIGIGLSF